jgi:hypothetical protein
MSEAPKEAAVLAITDTGQTFRVTWNAERESWEGLDYGDERRLLFRERLLGWWPMPECS